MSRLLNIIVIITTLAVTGWLKMPYEQKLSDELHELKLVPPRLSIDDRSRLKQKAFIATYGSLRPTIAAFMSIRTTSYHSNQEWGKIEDSFSEIVLLDPYNLYYWDQASWHMSSNAAADKQMDKNLTEVAREKAFQAYIQKGKDILEHAIQVNPNDWRFLILKARLESNRYRNPDYHSAIETYRDMLKSTDLPEHIRRSIRIAIQYCLQHIPELHQEAYDHALKLFKSDTSYRVPRVQNQILIGQNHPLNKVTNHMPLEEIYGSNETAYKQLRTKLKRRNIDLKLYGVTESIKKLEDKLDIPQQDRLIQHKPLFLKE